MPKAKKVIDTPNFTPGVGTYEDQSPRLSRKSPSFRMRQRTTTDIDLALKSSAFQPGPANYQPF